MFASLAGDCIMACRIVLSILLKHVKMNREFLDRLSINRRFALTYAAGMLLGCHALFT